MASEVAHAPDLHPGAAGELTPWVTYLQQLLTAAGSKTYSGPINGVFDAVVDEAVKHVQTGMAAYAREHHEPEHAVGGS